MTPLTLNVGDGQTVPHWALMPEDTWSLFEDFETFLGIVFDHMGFNPPTKQQRAIARRLQYAPVGPEGGVEDVIRAFRGVGKSIITAAFVIWRLMRNPRDEKVMVVSATTTKAKEFVGSVRSLLNTMPVLTFLRPDDDQTNQADRFDVKGASLGQNRSLKAAGITGQITGSRTTLQVPDDIEIPNNSKTEEARATLMRLTADLEAIKLPGTDTIYLGTPQTEQSIYNRLVQERGYTSYTIPARVPAPGKMAAYVIRTDDGVDIDILAPDLKDDIAAGRLRPGDPTDPERFDATVLNSREAKGRSFFALQYQLDTSLSDAERYPLRQKDLVVFECSPLKAPRTLQWGRHSDAKNLVADIPNVGFSGDYLLRPLFVDEDWREYESKVLFVDPSGRGKDETAWWIVGHLNGLLYGLHMGALASDPAEAMQRIAADAKRFNVTTVEVEPNFAPGVWITAFQPILTKAWPGGCTVKESEWAKGRKEERIIDTLEPVMTQHRLVIAESILRADVRADDLRYSFAYQLTHITRDKGSLQHDDRLDALAGAVAHYLAALGLDVSTAAADQAQSERDEYVRRFLGSHEDQALVRRRGALRDGKRGEAITVHGPGRAGVIVWEGDEEDEMQPAASPRWGAVY